MKLSRKTAINTYFSDAFNSASSFRSEKRSFNDFPKKACIKFELCKGEIAIQGLRYFDGNKPSKL